MFSLHSISGSAISVPETGAPSNVYELSIDEALVLSDDATTPVFWEVVAESLSLSDDPRTPIWWEAVAESLVLSENASLPVFWEIIAEALALSDDASFPVASEILETIEEALSFFGENSSVQSLFAINADQVGMLDAEWSKCNLNHNVNDALAVSDAVLSILSIIAKENLLLLESMTSRWIGTESAASALGMTERSSFGKIYRDLIADGIGVSDLSRIILQLKLIDSIRCLSEAGAIAKFDHQLSEALSMSDFIQRTWEKLIADGIALEDAAALINRAYGLALDSMAFSDGSTPEYRFNESVQDGFGLLPAVLLRSIIGAVIGDSLCLSVSVELDGEVWECWVLNTNRFHPSIYSGFNFNSYAIYEGRAYGCKSDGIYELTGQADGNEVIRTGVVLPETRFGSTHKKRFRYAFLGIAGDAPIIKVENEDDYAFYRIENNKTTIDRSLSGKIWTFSVMDFEELKYIELLPVVLTR